jgi:FkbM family methyltransferase
LLRLLYGRRQNVTLRQVAVGTTPGSARMLTSRLNPTVATLSSDWVRTVQQAQGFRPVLWESSVDVEVVTLDDLIAQYAIPAFCKLDIEGYESAALRGLSVALPLVAFEFIPAALEEAVACVHRLMELGGYAFNWSVGERLHLQEPVWVDDEHIVQRLNSFDLNDRSGDIYARLVT